MSMSAENLRRIQEEEKVGGQLGLAQEWQRQANRFITLRFHQYLTLSEQDYLDSLPQFTLQPEQFKGRFDIPLLVETRIPVSQQAKRANVRYCLDGLNVLDWDEDPQGYKTPTHPYVTWVRDSVENTIYNAEDARSKLQKDERGGTEYDGISFYIRHPQALKGHFSYLLGTSVAGPREKDVAFMGDGGDGPLIFCVWANGTPSGYTSLICGRV